MVIRNGGYSCLTNNSKRVAKAELVLLNSNERIELKTVADVNYAKYRLLRLRLDYPEKFNKQSGDSVE